MNSFLSHCRRHTRSILAGLTLVSIALPTSATGPILVCDTGVPLTWPNGGVSIPFNPDQGNLGPLTHADAVSLVQSAFGIWASLPDSTVTYVNAGELPVDVDITNFADYLQPLAPDGFSAIVFDNTGEIFDLLFGPDSGILGFAGPEWIDFSTCTIQEGVSFLNGPAFTDSTYALDIMVHEFGHYSGLAHSVVNGQIGLGDSSGPTPDFGTFGFPPNPFVEDFIETMYPFYFGPGIGTSSPEKDDIASISALYPGPDFAATTGTITGVIRSPFGGAPLTGINVIARNLTDPFEDAVSAISGDYSVAQGDTFDGHYTLRGLTPGANYAIFIDQIFAGGFSTPLIVLPGPEEFYNGANESNNLNTPDDPLEFTAVSATAGNTTAGIDIIINTLPPGAPLPVGDDGSFQLFLPFPFRIVGQSFDTVFVNANGNLTFGGPDGSFSPSVGAFLDGPPRIAGLWRDLNSSAGGVVTYAQTATTFSVLWKNVPAFPATGANTFTITLKKGGNQVEVKYGAISAQDGIAGISGGFNATGGQETPTDLGSSVPKKTRIGLWSQPAIFEEFNGGNPFDLAGKTVRYQHDIDYNDRWAGKNNTFEKATAITLPFRSATVAQYTEIDPVGSDVDFFKFPVKAGDVIRVELTRGGFDSVAGIFAPDGSLVAVDDDGGINLLSKVEYLAPADGIYAAAVSAFDDFGFTGAGGSGGRYVLKVETVSCGLPSPANWVVNNSFETGDFLCWNVIETGTPFIPLTVTDGSLATYFTPAVPQDGNFLAVGGFDGDGPMQVILYQDVTIPPGEPFLTLEWRERLQWQLFVGPTVSRTYAVLILDPTTNGLLQIVRILDTGIAPDYTDTGWLSQSYDVSSFIGQTIRLMFFQDIPESFTGPGQFELDDVRLRSQ